MKIVKGDLMTFDKLKAINPEWKSDLRRKAKKRVGSAVFVIKEGRRTSLPSHKESGRVLRDFFMMLEVG